MNCYVFICPRCDNNGLPHYVVQVVSIRANLAWLLVDKRNFFMNDITRESYKINDFKNETNSLVNRFESDILFT